MLVVGVQGWPGCADSGAVGSPELEFVFGVASDSEPFGGSVVMMMTTEQHAVFGVGGPRGERRFVMDLQADRVVASRPEACAVAGGGASMRLYKEAGFTPLPGFQLRYLYLLDPTARERLTVPVLPFSAIDAAGARMYRGKPCVRSADSGTTPQE